MPVARGTVERARRGSSSSFSCGGAACAAEVAQQLLRGLLVEAVALVALWLAGHLAEELLVVVARVLRRRQRSRSRIWSSSPRSSKTPRHWRQASIRTPLRSTWTSWPPQLGHGPFAGMRPRVPGIPSVRVVADDLRARWRRPPCSGRTDRARPGATVRARSRYPRPRTRRSGAPLRALAARRVQEDRLSAARERRRRDRCARRAADRRARAAGRGSDRPRRRPARGRRPAADAGRSSATPRRCGPRRDRRRRTDVRDARRLRGARGRARAAARARPGCGAGRPATPVLVAVGTAPPASSSSDSAASSSSAARRRRSRAAVAAAPRVDLVLTGGETLGARSTRSASPRCEPIAQVHHGAVQCGTPGRPPRPDPPGKLRRPRQPRADRRQHC